MFFIPSADSGAVVVDSIASRGNPKSPVWQRLFWALVLGVTASVLLLAGGLKALQAMTLVAALPVGVIMLVLCYGLWRGLVADQAHSTQDLSPTTSLRQIEPRANTLLLIPGVSSLKASYANDCNLRSGFL